MPRIETEELLKDARLVIDYAVRIGICLTKNLSRR